MCDACGRVDFQIRIRITRVSRVSPMYPVRLVSNEIKYFFPAGDITNSEEPSVPAAISTRQLFLADADDANVDDDSGRRAKSRIIARQTGRAAARREHPGE